MDVIYRAARNLIIALEDVQLDETEEEVGTKYHEMYQAMCKKVKKTAAYRQREAQDDRRTFRTQCL